MNEEIDSPDWIETANERLIEKPFCAGHIGQTFEFRQTGVGNFSWETRRSTDTLQRLSLKTQLNKGTDTTGLWLALFDAHTGREVVGCRWLLIQRQQRNLFISTPPALFYFQLQRKTR